MSTRKYVVEYRYDDRVVAWWAEDWHTAFAMRAQSRPDERASRSRAEFRSRILEDAMSVDLIENDSDLINYFEHDNMLRHSTNGRRAVAKLIAMHWDTGLSRELSVEALLAGTYIRRGLFLTTFKPEREVS